MEERLLHSPSWNFRSKQVYLSGFQGLLENDLSLPTPKFIISSYVLVTLAMFGFFPYFSLVSTAKWSMLEPANTGSIVVEIDDGIFTPQKSANTTFQSSSTLLPKSRLLKNFQQWCCVVFQILIVLWCTQFIKNRRQNSEPNIVLFSQILSFM